MLKNKGLISKTDERYMDAVHHTANVSIVSINNLLARAIRELYELIIKIDETYKPEHKLKFEINEFKLTDKAKKQRFIELVKLGQEFNY